MKSIKPGRGISGMNFIGSIFAIIFGIIWTISTMSITANSPFLIGKIFPLFGILFIIIGIAQAVYNYKNATSKNRYSIVDITDSSEEEDPSDNWVKGISKDDEEKEQQDYENLDINYCPYCGEKLKNKYKYCPKCGKEIR